MRQRADLPAAPNNPVSLRLETSADKKVLEFTPTVVGEFQFMLTSSTAA